MRKIGLVVKILNSENLLIKCVEEMSPDDLVTVCGVVKLPSDDESGIERVIYPKGQLNILARQEDDVYLAATAKFKTEYRTVYQNPFSTNSKLIRQIYGPPEEIVERVPVTQPARVDKRQSLDVVMPLVIQEGDGIYTHDIEDED